MLPANSTLENVVSPHCASNMTDIPDVVCIANKKICVLSLCRRKSFSGFPQCISKHREILVVTAYKDEKGGYSRKCKRRAEVFELPMSSAMAGCFKNRPQVSSSLSVRCATVVRFNSLISRMGNDNTYALSASSYSAVASGDICQHPVNRGQDLPSFAAKGPKSDVDLCSSVPCRIDIPIALSVHFYWPF